MTHDFFAFSLTKLLALSFSGVKCYSTVLSRVKNPSFPLATERSNTSNAWRRKRFVIAICLELLVNKDRSFDVKSKPVFLSGGAHKSLQTLCVFFLFLWGIFGCSPRLVNTSVSPPKFDSCTLVGEMSFQYMHKSST